MARTRERRSRWPAHPDGAVPPAVVCVLNGSPPGRAAAAYAAALSRALDWPLRLVASGLRPLDPDPLTAAVAEERPGIIVVPVESCGAPAEAVELAERAGVPVVVVPTRWRAGASRLADVVVVARDELSGRASAIGARWGLDPIMLVPRLCSPQLLAA